MGGGGPRAREGGATGRPCDATRHTRLPRLAHLVYLRNAALAHPANLGKLLASLDGRRPAVDDASHLCCKRRKGRAREGASLGARAGRAGRAAAPPPPPPPHTESIGLEVVSCAAQPVSQRIEGGCHVDILRRAGRQGRQGGVVNLKSGGGLPPLGSWHACTRAAQTFSWGNSPGRWTLRPPAWS